MITKKQYVEYLIHTPINYTCSNLAEHLEGVSHDAISDDLHREHLSAHDLWERVEPLLENTAESYLIIDDSVQNKQYSQQIELVKRQYSGAEHGLIRGINIVNLVQITGEEYFPVDYRIYRPQADGKTKNEHFREMLLAAKDHKGIQAQRVLFDSWYASVKNLKLVHRMGLIFVTTLKSNRLVSLSKAEGYVHLDEIEWTAERLEHGIPVKLQEVPFLVQLFKIVTPDGDIDWVITNRSEPALTAQDVQKENAIRWHGEQLHRELKQLTGTEKCQCRKARSQRTHLACCYHAWLSLKLLARALKTTLYAVRAGLFRSFLQTQLCSPSIPAFALG